MNLPSPFALVFLLLIPLASAAPAVSAGGLDQQRLHSDYNEGNFEKVVAAEALDGDP